MSAKASFADPKLFLLLSFRSSLRMSHNSSGWYPGKNIKEHIKSKKQTDGPDDPEIEAAQAAALKAQELEKKKDEKWYPGKNIKDLKKKLKEGNEKSPELKSENQDEKSMSITAIPRASLPVQSSGVMSPNSSDHNNRQFLGNDPIIDAKGVSNQKAKSEKWYPGKHIEQLRKDKQNEIMLETINTKEEQGGKSHELPNLHLHHLPDEETDEIIKEQIEKQRLAHLASQAESKWYPGKFVSNVPRPLLALRRHVISKRHLQQSTDQAVRVATLRVSMLRGRSLSSLQRPYAELNVEGFEQRTKTAKTSSPDWTEQKAFVFNVCDLSRATLSIHLFDDYNIHHNVCVGRVLVPLNSLLTSASIAPTEVFQSLLKGAGRIVTSGQILTDESADNENINVFDKLLSPKFGAVPPMRKWYRVFPPAPNMANKIHLDKAKAESKGSHEDTDVSPSDAPNNQKADHHLRAQFLANNHYETGVLGVSGSAMNRPKVPLGYLELELELNLAVGAASAYFLSATEDVPKATKPSNDNKNDDDNDKPNQEEQIEQLQPKVLRDNMGRVKRCLQAKSPLLSFDFVRRFVLVPLTIRACFFMPAHEFPLWCFFLFVIHGFLSHKLQKRSHLINTLTSQNLLNELENDDFNLDDDLHGDNNKHEEENIKKILSRTSKELGECAWNTTPALRHEREWRKVPPWVLIFEDEIGPDSMPKGFIAKIKLLKDTVTILQKVTGKLAVMMERSANLWNWSDPIVTALATLSLAAACIATSILLRIVSLRLIICAGLIAVLLKAEIKSFKEKQKKNSQDGQATTDEFHAGNENSLFDVDEEVEDDEEVEVVGQDSQDKFHKAAARKAKLHAMKAKSAVASLLVKIPDDAELIHRNISSLQPLSEKEMLREIASVAI